MSRAASGGGDFSLSPGLNQPGARPDEATAYVYGADRPSTPEGMRALTAAERAHNCVFTWSVELGTYVSPEFPDGVS